MPTEEVILWMRVREQARANAELQQTARAIQGVQKAVDSSSKSTGRGETSWFSWGRAMRWATTGGVVYGLYGIARGIEQIIVGVARAGISFNAMKESAQLTFATLLRSTPKANALIAQLYTLAAHTPFTFQNVTQGAQQLLAFGFAANRVVPMLRTLANVAAGNPLMGQEAVTHLALVLGQIRASGRLLGQDALQLAQFGINAYQIVADKLGKSYNETRIMGEKGLISSSFAISAILDYMNRRFTGLAQKQSRTILGLWSTLQDESAQAAGTLMAPFMPAIKRGLDNLNNFLMRPSTQRGLVAFSNGMKEVFGPIGLLFFNFARLTISVISALGPVWQFEARLMAPFIGAIYLVARAMGILSEQGTALRVVLFPLWATAYLGVKALELLDFATLHPVRAFRSLLGEMEPVRGVWNWFWNHASLGLDVHVSLSGAWHTAVGLLERASSLPVRIGAAAVAGVRASGGRGTGPMLVGERGPELAWLPQGSRVDSHAESSMPSVGGGDRGPMVAKLFLDKRVIAEAVFDYVDDRRARR